MFGGHGDSSCHVLERPVGQDWPMTNALPWPSFGDKRHAYVWPLGRLLMVVRWRRLTLVLLDYDILELSPVMDSLVLASLAFSLMPMVCYLVPLLVAQRFAP